MPNIDAIQIFRTGKWKGDQYSEKDLDAMVDAAKRSGREIPIKLSTEPGKDPHAPGGPAYGWVNTKTLRREGDRLVADFVDIPDEIHKAIKDRRYDQVSSEIAWGLKSNDQTFPRALKAVSILGADMPAVSGLKPIRESFHDAEGTYQKQAVYTFDRENDFKEHDPMPDDKKEKELQAKLDEATKKLAETESQVKKLREEAEAREGDESKTSEELKKLTAERDADRKRIAQLEEGNRKNRIQGYVDKVRIPSAKNFVRALAEYALADEEKTVTFSVDGKDEEVKRTDAVEKFIEYVNSPTSALLKELSEHKARPEAPADEEAEDFHDASEKLQKLAKEAMAKDKDLDIDAAQEKVLAEHPELAKVYTNG